MFLLQERWIRNQEEQWNRNFVWWKVELTIVQNCERSATSGRRTFHLTMELKYKFALEIFGVQQSQGQLWVFRNTKLQYEKDFWCVDSTLLNAENICKTSGKYFLDLANSSYNCKLWNFELVQENKWNMYFNLRALKLTLLKFLEF